MNTFYPLTVSEIKRETPLSVSITFTIPETLKDTFTFIAGQYITIKHTIDDNEIRRAYSICSIPSSGILKIGVKEVPNGSFSVYANHTLKVGDTLEVLPPQGKFIFTPSLNSNIHYAAFVAGSGITPVLSMITSAMKHETESTFLLVYGNRNVEQTMFYNDLIQLKESYPNRFFIEFVFSREDIDGSLFGRIDTGTVNFFIKNKYKETHFSKFYLCGPEKMIHTVTETLKTNNVAKEHILFELFTTPEEKNPIEIKDGSTNLTLTVDDQTHTFTMPQTQTVLDAALKEDIDTPYSCRGGVCSTCIAKIVEGKAVMKKNQILTDDEIEDGYILTCQAHPTTTTLTIDYDDV